jgi:Uma2 family endonuclease
MPGQAARRMFTTNEYHRMAEAGILSADDRVELLDGEIVRISPSGSRHAACVDRLTSMFFRQLGRRVIVRVQNPIVLDRYSEPQPDLSLLRPRADFYAERHPRPPDVLLVVEAVDASTRAEAERKIQLYAGAGVREVWIVDLTRAAIRVLRRPALGVYRHDATVDRGHRLSLAAFPRIAFRSSRIF